ncbi:MAG TPA: tetratricopeptide repeat protein [bacterium]|nr:tetratricopeptide repeat protein [bacterium]
MIFCPACSAENPDGTKICVKCGTELPKAAAFTPPTVKAAAGPAVSKAPEKPFGVRDMGRDMVDALWLIAILALLLIGFIGEVTQWTFKFTETDEAKLVQAPVLATAPAHPRAHGHAGMMGRHHGVSIPAHHAGLEETKPVVEFGNPDSLYAKGKDQYDHKNYHGSYESLKKALEIDPTYAKGYFAMGYLYARFNMNDVAVRMYEMALRFDPKFADPINNLAMLYKKAGNQEDALSLLQQAVALDGSNADFQYNLGEIYLDQDQPDQALEAFQKAVALRPSDPSIYNDMALTYERLGKKQEAEDAWNKVIQYGASPDYLKQAKTHLDYLQAQS